MGRRERRGRGRGRRGIGVDGRNFVTYSVCLFSFSAQCFGEEGKATRVCSTLM